LFELILHANRYYWTTCISVSLDFSVTFCDLDPRSLRRTKTLVTDSCSAEWQCFSCTVYKFAYLLSYLLTYNSL